MPIYTHSDSNIARRNDANNLTYGSKTVQTYVHRFTLFHLIIWQSKSTWKSMI